MQNKKFTELTGIERRGILDTDNAKGEEKMKRLLSCLLILACLLSAAAASAQAEQNVLTDQMIVVNCEEWVSLRESPDTSSTRLAKVPLNARVSGCKDSGDFIYCEYEGQQGYILAKYLKPVYSYSLQSFIQEFSGEDLADIKNNGFILDTAYSYGSDSETIEVVCRDGKGVEIWRQSATSSTRTELDMTAFFLAGTADQPLAVIYAYGDGLTAIDAWTGEMLWKLPTDQINLGGSLSWAVDKSGRMYVCGYYGPDPVAIDMNGEVVWEAALNTTDIYWPYEMEVREDCLAVHYSCTDGQGGTPGWVRFDWAGNMLDVNLD